MLGVGWMMGMTIDLGTPEKGVQEEVRLERQVVTWYVTARIWDIIMMK